eukprot:Blabericola_migrator_1__11191@NODE_656_length_7018_cov_80_985470_g480_i0_p2_GENE_NODE_656_length_7018_cov_80_985470_g480_i0NODE_656_length_7018_cov_80_985470_g480_i0_p2_ORF_typecomplete_len479_score67_76REV/PF00424_18/0_015MCRS_N/PF13325_6/0_39HrpB2/PF09487_10/86HrpB2/PF09487_10/7_3_NODE_656_length_7018_cov_80_985470_g480_i040375473
MSPSGRSVRWNSRKGNGTMKWCVLQAFIPNAELKPCIAIHEECAADLFEKYSPTLASLDLLYCLAPLFGRDLSKTSIAVADNPDCPQLVFTVGSKALPGAFADRFLDAFEAATKARDTNARSVTPDIIHEVLGHSMGSYHVDKHANEIIVTLPFTQEQYAELAARVEHSGEFDAKGTAESLNAFLQAALGVQSQSGFDAVQKLMLQKFKWRDIAGQDHPYESIDELFDAELGAVDQAKCKLGVHERHQELLEDQKVKAKEAEHQMRRIQLQNIMKEQDVKLNRLRELQSLISKNGAAAKTVEALLHQYEEDLLSSVARPVVKKTDGGVKQNVVPETSKVVRTGDVSSFIPITPAFVPSSGPFNRSPPQYRSNTSWEPQPKSRGRRRRRRRRRKRHLMGLAKRSNMSALKRLLIPAAQPGGNLIQLLPNRTRQRKGFTQFGIAEQQANLGVLQKRPIRTTLRALPGRKRPRSEFSSDVQ